MNNDIYIKRLLEESKAWLRNQYPCEYSLNRDKLTNEREYEAMVIKDALLKNDAYASIFSLANRDKNVYDTLFLDVDKDDINVVRDIIKCFRVRIEQFILPRVYFSGRGFHIYFDFFPTKFTNYKKAVKKLIERTVPHEILKETDQKIIGDIERMARIPLTFNTKRERYMIPVYLSDKDIDYDRESRNPNRTLYRKPLKPIRSATLTKHLLILDNYPEETKPRELKKDSFHFDKLPPCIYDTIEKAMTTNYLVHEERLLLATFLVNKGYERELRDILSILNDYNETYTSYQIEWIKSKRYSPYSCKVLEGMGLCSKRCSYFPYMLKDVICDG